MAAKRKTTSRKKTSSARSKTTSNAKRRKKTVSKSAAQKTTDHDEIRRAVEARGGCPATVKSTHKKGDVGLLRIDFPGYSGQQTLESISWDEFFDKFDKEHLALLYQEKTKNGRPSRFFKLIRDK